MYNPDPNPLMTMYMHDVLSMEAPYIYHRWSLYAIVSSLLGRRTALDYAGRDLYPNLYLLIVGEPACKKSTPIQRARSLLQLSGYNYFGRDSMNRRSLVQDLITGRHITHLRFTAPKRVAKPNLDAAMAASLPQHMRPVKDLREQAETWSRQELEDLKELGEQTDELYAHMGIFANEFTDLLGARSGPVLHTLNNLYDCNHSYADDLGVIQYPYITLLAAINPGGFVNIFTPETLSQGLMTRMLLIYAEPSGRHCSPFGMSAKQVHEGEIIEQFRRIKNLKGEFRVLSDAEQLFINIADVHPKIADSRFSSYNQRRSEILAKMAMCNSVMRGDDLCITVPDVLYANTLLTFTEHSMPDALGSFAYDDTTKRTQKILKLLKSAPAGMTMEQLYKALNVGDSLHTHEIQQAISKLAFTGEIVQMDKNEDGHVMYAYKEQSLEKYRRYDGNTIIIDWLPEWVEQLQ